jgi:hypothetical protein
VGQQCNPGVPLQSMSVQQSKPGGWHTWPKQHTPPGSQKPAPHGTGGGVVVLVVVVGASVVVVVVVCAWQVPRQMPLQHCAFFLHFFPVGLHSSSATATPPMPSDPSVPPTTAAPINLSALPRVRVPSASPLARSSKKLSSLAIAATASHSWIISPNQYRKVLSDSTGLTDEQNLALFEQNLALFRRIHADPASRARRTSQNTVNAKYNFRECTFHALR